MRPPRNGFTRSAAEIARRTTEREGPHSRLRPKANDPLGQTPGNVGPSVKSSVALRVDLSPIRSPGPTGPGPRRDRTSPQLRPNPPVERASIAHHEAISSHDPASRTQRQETMMRIAAPPSITMTRLRRVNL